MRWPKIVIAEIVLLRLIIIVICIDRHSTEPEDVLHYVYQFGVSIQENVYPTVIGSPTNMTSPLQLTNSNNEEILELVSEIGISLRDFIRIACYEYTVLKLFMTPLPQRYK